MIRSLAIISNLLLAACAFGAPTTWYVDWANGVDNAFNVANPTINNPLHSMSYALVHTTNGPDDKFIFRAGTNYENIYAIPQNSGTPGHPVVITVQPLEDVWIVVTNQLYGIQFFDNTYDYRQHPPNFTNFTHDITLDGSWGDGYLPPMFEFTAGRHIHITGPICPRGIMIRQANSIRIHCVDVDFIRDNDHIKFASNNQDSTTQGGGGPGTVCTNDMTGPTNCLVDYCSLHNGGDYGIKLTGWGTRYNFIISNAIYRCGSFGSDNHGANISGSGYGFYDSGSAVPPHLIRHDNPTNIFITDRNTTASNTCTVGYNTFIGNVIWSNYNHGLQFTTTFSNVVHGNISMYNGLGSSAGAGLSFGSYAWGSLMDSNICNYNRNYGIYADNWAVSNNIIKNLSFDNGTQGIRVAHTSYWCNVIGNTMLATNGSDSSAFYSYQWCTNLTLKNNIGIQLSTNGGTPVLYCVSGSDSNSVMDYNLWWTPRAVGNPSIIYVADGSGGSIQAVRTNKGWDLHGMVLDPGTIHMTNLIKDLHLNFWSPAINSGSVWPGLSYVGSAPDIGYYEFWPGVPPKEILPHFTHRPVQFNP